ncbi:N-acetyltransferase [Shewanella algicola]|uniref:GNAT family N-acetyltransferase n=1 Tax=Shewanella algicola TaxID=640633 RepID=A0A9X1Z2N7_9GAMM|nr:GNAT family N-acetyltransferase [Shewanella algicola]MCL1104481.1 GNAT family N-acetyltransferase [Shewanella algicola]GGP43482.1 N-acetyltransferase [Shewanella algicola]
MNIVEDDLQDAGVIELLQAHLADMYATSPAESVHALDIDALTHPSMTFWCAKLQGEVLGCVAIKQLNETHGEIKSMRTSAASRNQGVATALLLHLLNEAKRRGYQQLSLETGSMDFFAPARRLYQRHGFDYCGPFADYQADPNSLFMTRLID